VSHSLRPQAHLGPAPASTPPSTLSRYTPPGPTAGKSSSSRAHRAALGVRLCCSTRASVAIVARTRDALDETRDIIVAAVQGADVLVLAADVCDAESVRAAVQRVIRTLGSQMYISKDHISLIRCLCNDGSSGMLTLSCIR
jgi:hypothetical protein